jgi:hypothetical protein
MLAAHGAAIDNRVNGKLSFPHSPRVLRFRLIATFASAWWAEQVRDIRVMVRSTLLNAVSRPASGVSCNAHWARFFSLHSNAFKSLQSSTREGKP